MLKILFITSLVMFVSMSPSLAQTPKFIRKFKAWGEYRYQSKSGPVCYALTTPLTQQPADVDHGDNFFMISQQPGQGVQHQPEIKAGYQLNAKKNISITIDDTGFTMMAQGDHAWLTNIADKPRLMARLRSGHEMIVEATSKRGTKTRYTYSLAGVSAALKAIAHCR